MGDNALEDLLDSIPEKCPECGTRTVMNPEDGFAAHVKINEDALTARCEAVTADADGDADSCDTTLSSDQGRP